MESILQNKFTYGEASIVDSNLTTELRLWWNGDLGGVKLKMLERDTI